ncbi:hypothetical protein [Noviherbaspirillum autotrophicum]|nr:hypothetical protein [Noviherbaspirillum autotrophicum]
MKSAELCEKYQDALSKKDFSAIQTLFTSDAVIKAPISGAVTVECFHAYLFCNTKKTMAKFPNVLKSRYKFASITMQFSYTLFIATGDAIGLDGVVAFEVDESVGKFKRMTVIYDASDLRRFMDNAGVAGPITSLSL